MKNVCIILGTILLVLLLVYGTLAYCVFFYYDPLIAKEASRQGGWIQAIDETEEECAQLTRLLTKSKGERKRQKDKLEQTVKVESSRNSMAEKMFTRNRWSDYDWRRRTRLRLKKAQKELDDFESNYERANEDIKSRVVEVHKRLDILHTRQQTLEDLCEKRDKLMIWPLSLIAPLLEK